MTSQNAIEALRRHRSEESASKQREVLRAVQDLTGRNAAITVAGVAREAGVSREFIHSHPHLRKAVSDAAQSAEELRDEDDLRAGASLRGLRADRATLLQKVRRQQEQLQSQGREIDDLKNQRKKWLGSHLPHPDRVDPEIHAELRVTNKRLMTDNAALRERVAELTRIVSGLEGDLTAVRQALSEEIASARGGNVTPMRKE